MDQNKTGKIEKKEFISIMQKEPDLLEIFDFLNRGGKYIFTSEEVEKREHDEKINRKIIKLEKDLKKINEFLHENFPLNEILDKFAEKTFPISPNTSPAQHKPKLVKAPSSKSEKFSFMNQMPVKEESKEEILATPMVKTARKSNIYPRVHGFEKNMVKILNDVDRLSPEILERNEFDLEGNEFVLSRNDKERLTMESVRPEFLNIPEVNRKEFDYLMELNPNKKEPGYISQIVINDDDQIFDGEDSKFYSSKKNFTFNNSDLYARASFGSENKEKKNLKFEKSYSHDVIGKENEKGRLKNTLLMSIDRSPNNRMDKITTTALALKEMLEITKEIREDYDKNALKYAEKNKEK